MTDHRPPSEPSYDPRPAGTVLAQRWRVGDQWVALPEEIRPSDLDAGYALQSTVLAQTGETPCGWKLGVGNPNALRKFNLSRPLFGRLTAQRMHDAAEPIVLSRSAPVTVEFEIAFVLNRDIAPGDAPADPFDAVASAHPAFELVLSRYVDRMAVGWPSFIGDNVGFEAFVLGEEVSLSEVPGIIERIEVYTDGVLSTRGVTGDDLPGTGQALEHLFEHAAHYGVTLRRGEIVTCGAVAKPYDVAAEDAEIEARYGIGALKIAFTR